ncbi:MAG: thrombospondin type 3 repeat-containing protein, partial [Myxococcota bacterium]
MFRASLWVVLALAAGCEPSGVAPVDRAPGGEVTAPVDAPPMELESDPRGGYGVTGGASPVVTQPIDWVDTDGDGIDDVSEAFYGTDPNNA